MAKIIKFDTEARSKMLTGVNTLANAVKVEPLVVSLLIFFQLKELKGFQAQLSSSRY